MSVVKNGLPVPAAKMTHALVLQVMQGLGAHEGLADGRHRDGREHARRHAQLLQRVLQGQRVHDGGQHAHVVGGGAIHALGGAGQPAEDVAAADHDGDLGARRHGIPDLAGEALHHRHVDAVGGLAHQRLAGKLQQQRACSAEPW